MYGQWTLVFLNATMFAVFLLLIPHRRRVKSRPGGVYLAFIVSFFVEMYGIPFTAYLVTALLGRAMPGGPLAPLYGYLGLEKWYPLIGNAGLGLMIGGMLLIILGWWQIHRGGDKLVTTGLYAHMRHPQYLGFLSMTLGMLVQWLTAPGLIMWPLLAAAYVRAAREEEAELEREFGKKYAGYRGRVPFMVPLARRR